MKKITVFFIIGLFSVSMHGRALPDYPSKWKNEIQYIYDSIFPSIPSNELPPCEFKRRQWIPLQTRASIDVYNEEDLARAIANNQSITINLKSDIFLSGNSTSSRNNTGSIQALLNIDKRKNIIINGEGTVQVVDITGRIIVSVEEYTRCIPTAGMTSGVYVLRLIEGDDVKTQKIVVR